jgi:hypothetical protein
MQIDNRVIAEHLTTDEAIRNVASVYNTDQMAITNMNVTNTVTANKLNVTGATTTKGLTNTGAFANTGNITNTGTLTSTGNITTQGTLNSTGIANVGAVYTKGGTNAANYNTHFPYSDGKNYIRGPTIVDGDITVNGRINIGNFYIAPWGDNPNYLGITSTSRTINPTTFIFDGTNMTHVLRPGEYGRLVYS